MSKEMDLGDYTLPAGLRVYAIGDIHGCLTELDRMHDLISADLLDRPPQDVHIVYLGDYVDRGPDSKGVIERLIERRDRGDGIGKTFLAGNHELAAFEFMRDPFSTDWLDYGGLETLQSYGIDLSKEGALPSEVERAAIAFKDQLSPSHWGFYTALDVATSFGDFFFVHAGVDPHKALEAQNLESMTTMREPFLSWDKPLKKMVVHGHSLFEAPEVKPHRISVDTGCYESGILTAAVIEGNALRFLQT